MLLAEALSLRSDVQKRIAQLESRIVNSARYQEGEEPSEDSASLLAEAREAIREFEVLVATINRTNSTALIVLDSGEELSIADAIARRDALGRHRKLIVSAADAARGSDWERRSTRSELKMVSALDVKALRSEADRLAADYRQLDLRIQAANWATEVA